MSDFDWDGNGWSSGEAVEMAIPSATEDTERAIAAMAYDLSMLRMDYRDLTRRRYSDRTDFRAQRKQLLKMESVIGVMLCLVGLGLLLSIAAIVLAVTL